MPIGRQRIGAERTDPRPRPTTGALRCRVGPGRELGAHHERMVDWSTKPPPSYRPGYRVTAATGPTPSSRPRAAHRATICPGNNQPAKTQTLAPPALRAATTAGWAQPARSGQNDHTLPARVSRQPQEQPNGTHQPRAISTLIDLRIRGCLTMMARSGPRTSACTRRRCSRYHVPVARGGGCVEPRDEPVPLGVPRGRPAAAGPSIQASKGPVTTSKDS
jgi:hypothetical protein